MSEDTQVRRWRRARPQGGGWWMFREDGMNYDQTLWLCNDGSEVGSDEDWEQATGKTPLVDGWEKNYWELTPTTQVMMPGLWMKC